MKKALFLSSLFVLLGAFGFSQNIPNPGFENWTTASFGYDDPDGWVTLNILSSPLLGGSPLSVSQGTGPNAHAGTYGAVVETIEANNPPITLPSDTLGILAIGTMTSNNVIFGTNYNGRPDTLYFYFKSDPMPGDTSGGFVTLTRTLNGNQITVASGFWLVDSTTVDYTLQAIPLTYQSSEVPDTLQIFFSPSSATIAIPGSQLTIDDVYFNNTLPTVSQAETMALDYVAGPSSVAVAVSDSVLPWNDATTLSSAKVWISDNYQSGEDVLVYATIGGITGTFDAATGILSLSGNASINSYRSALRAVGYKNNSANPNTSIRTVSYSIADGADQSNINSRDIAVISTVGTSTIAATNVNLALFPNPAHHFLTVRSSASTANQLIVLDLLGNTMMRQTYTGVDNMLDIQSLSPGLYLLEMTDINGGIISTKKFSIVK